MEASKDYREAVRLARLWKASMDRGDRASALIVRSRIERWYTVNKLRGFWCEFASDWFQV